MTIMTTTSIMTMMNTMMMNMKMIMKMTVNMNVSVLEENIIEEDLQEIVILTENAKILVMTMIEILKEIEEEEAWVEKERKKKKKKYLLTQYLKMLQKHFKLLKMLIR